MRFAIAALFQALFLGRQIFARFHLLFLTISGLAVEHARLVANESSPVRIHREPLGLY
jgi:hypothetical protein